jgi:predicted nucleotidyltransferase
MIWDSGVGNSPHKLKNPDLTSENAKDNIRILRGWYHGKEPMRPSVALDMKRSAVRDATCRFRAANPRVFGSVLHGADEDLDLLVDALPGATLFDLGGLQVELESMLGIRSRSADACRLKWRGQVLAEARPV